MLHDFWDTPHAYTKSVNWDLGPFFLCEAFWRVVIWYGPSTQTHARFVYPHHTHTLSLLFYFCSLPSSPLPSLSPFLYLFLYSFWSMAGFWKPDASPHYKKQQLTTFNASHLRILIPCYFYYYYPHPFFSHTHKRALRYHEWHFPLMYFWMTFSLQTPPLHHHHHHPLLLYLPPPLTRSTTITTPPLLAATVSKDHHHNNNLGSMDRH